MEKFAALKSRLFDGSTYMHCTSHNLSLAAQELRQDDTPWKSCGIEKDVDALPPSPASHEVRRAFVACQTACCQSWEACLSKNLHDLKAANVQKEEKLLEFHAAIDRASGT